mmetsp:Transcript_34324/g.88006  ORF Transcript_34324/g.88006 Transcript_34324/m.88006 type:complete len:88 (+) Transcript_34324:1137-1400(+)
MSSLAGLSPQSRLLTCSAAIVQRRHRQRHQEQNPAFSASGGLGPRLGLHSSKGQTGLVVWRARQDPLRRSAQSRPQAGRRHVNGNLA